MVKNKWMLKVISLSLIRLSKMSKKIRKMRMMKKKLMKMMKRNKIQSKTEDNPKKIMTYKNRLKWIKREKEKKRKTIKIQE